MCSELLREIRHTLAVFPPLSFFAACITDSLINDVFHKGFITNNSSSKQLFLFHHFKYRGITQCFITIYGCGGV